jgi:hypothetical protein
MANNIETQQKKNKIRYDYMPKRRKKMNLIDEVQNLLLIRNVKEAQQNKARVKKRD